MTALDALALRLAPRIGALCLARIAAQNEPIPARAQRDLAELGQMLEAVGRGDTDGLDRGFFHSLGEAMIDLGQRPRIQERALFEATAQIVYAIDASVDTPDGAHGATEEGALQNLAGAVRAAASVGAIAEEVIRAVVAHDAAQHLFREELRVALRRFVDALCAARPAERLLGVALLTDDNLCTLGPIACTAESLAGADADARWLPVEWSCTEGSEVFALAARMLVASYEAHRADLATHTRRSFESLVHALRALRERGRLQRADGCLVPFPRDVLLVPPSTDPCEALERWMLEAAGALNEPEVATAFRRAYGG